MRRHVFSSLCVISMGVAVAALSCSSDDSARSPDSVAEALGSIGLALMPVPGVSVNSFSYTITGPGGFTRSASLDVSHSKTLSALISGLPVGSGFTITVSGSSADGSASCSGSAGFSISANATTQVTTHLQCRVTPKTGSVLVNGELNVCPVIEGIDASPAEVMVGSALQLSATASDSDHAPTPQLSYQWSAASGSFSDAATASPSFTCSEAGSVTLALQVGDGDCSTTSEVTVTCSSALLEVVAASVETTPVPDSGDAADDPAVWVHPTQPELSVIIGTDKQAGGGLGVYGLDGSQLQYLPFGKLNNVDLRDGFPLGGANVTLVTAGNRSDDSIAIFALDATTRLLTDVAARKITTLATYGSCMYKSPDSGKYYYFVDAKDGTIEQWELFESAGKVDAVKVRDLHQLSSQPEACAVDDEARALFVGEEAKGVWRFDAEPSVTSGPGYEGVLIASTDPGGHLAADVEGVAIGKTGPSSGYIFVSNQGESTYSVFERQAPHAYVKTFQVARGSACVDEVTGSDGIEVNTANLGPAFPHGVFVTQDDNNNGLNQNFKLVRLEHILGTAPAVDDSACDGMGGSGGSSSGGSSSGGTSSSGGASGAGGSGGTASSGYGEPFCTTFCDKCASCFATGTFTEGDCVYQVPKTAFTLADCQAGCAVSATPGAAAKAALSDGFENLSCTAFDEGM